MAVCALTMYSRVPEHCVNDILLVLSQVHHFSNLIHTDHLLLLLLPFSSFLKTAPFEQKRRKF